MITVVGASTSGLFAAYLLAKAGFKVRVFEKNNVIGPPRRTLIVTGKILAILNFDLGDIVINQIKRVEFFSPNQKNSLEFKNPDLIIEREKLLRHLAEKASAAGAEIQTGVEFKNQTVDKNEILVDASGVKKSAKTVALLQAEVEVPTAIDKETIQVFFDRGKTKYFFWLIPKSEREAAVGLIANDANGIKKTLDDFLAEKNFKVLSYQQGRAPLFSPRTKIQKGKTFLVGDAAGQVKVDTVGGVVAGLRGAKALAQGLIKRTSYRREVRGLNWELTLHWLARRVLNNLTNKDYDRLLTLLTPEVKQVFARCTRDEAARGVLKLFLAQPRVLLFLPKIIF